MKEVYPIIIIVAVFAVVAMVVSIEKPILSGQATQVFCHETDGGMNIHVSGRITTTKKELAFDKCLDSKTLVEKFCSEQGVVQEKVVNCVAEGYRVCSNGACFR